MASLRKPLSCPECDATQFLRYYKPERWVCSRGHVATERPQRNDSNLCRDCKAGRDTKPFRKGKNQCVECFNSYLVQWRANNPEKWRVWRKKHKNSLQITVRRAIQKDHTSFLTALFGHLQKRVRHESGKKMVAKGKLNPACLTVEIDLPFILSLWESQTGRCALSGLGMCHRFNDLCAVSIDRKDSGLGYVPGNVQLVCQWVNKAKGNKTDAAMKAVINQLISDALSPPLANGGERASDVLFFYPANPLV